MKTQDKAFVCCNRNWKCMPIANDGPEQHRFASSRGFTLIELLLVVAILGILASLALPAFENYKDLAKVSRCKSEIPTIDQYIAIYLIDNGSNPQLLSNLPTTPMNDPWGHPYKYYNIITNTPAGSTRYTDIDGSDLNTFYDLYSLGKDNDTGNDLNDARSQDDIVRINDGILIELGSHR